VESYSTGTLLVEQWEDRRQVNMLNSFIPHQMVESTSANPRNTRMKPNSVMIYNAKMGGVDHVDQQMAPYESLRKSIKWYKKFAFHLFDLAVYNSYVIFKFHCTNTKESKLIYKNYLMALIEEMIEKNVVTRSRVGRPVLVSRGQPSTTNKVQHIAHFPMKILKANGKPSNSDCHLCHSKGKRKATPFKCTQCSKRLCIDRTNCFMEFHQNLQNQLDPATETRMESQVQSIASHQATSQSLLDPEFQIDSQSLLNSQFQSLRSHQVTQESQLESDQPKSQSLLDSQFQMDSEPLIQSQSLFGSSIQEHANTYLTW